MDPNTFKAIINNHFEIELKSDDLKDLDIISNSNNQYHIIDNDESIQAKVLEMDMDKKTFTIEINGNEYQVRLQDHFDILIQKMGLNAASSQKMNEVKAPMPGLVLDILVENGQTVQKGDALFILEAMKMENLIKATGEGTVKSIEANKGQAVDKGQIIIEME